MIFRPYALAVSLLLFCGCEFHSVEPGPMVDDPVKLTLGKAERANVELHMGAGEMIVHTGAEDLLDGHFEYNLPSLKPEVRSSVVGSHETVTISQSEHVQFGGNLHSVWDLKLNNKVLVELAVNCGAGRAQLDLGDLRLRALEVKMGAGEVNLDLRGKPLQDYDVNISGGVGQAVVRLPTGVGIQAEAHGGLGNVSVTGLEKRGEQYQNDLYDKAKVNIRIKVQGGIGNIQIIA